ncbi:GNAT family N-acetyltransferase [Longimonas halophila]|uniref:GNAT family N-acetyltransferase n=1 Tax=Longimonas halophila TaxID=1469170 RepID=A0A2H3P8T8_9BACT|nr:GNAT family N-acetyltransferase [Longimonas halophila]PEN08331.1 GNAT family N-acetyltransferase [Longimonas halophila]
MSTLSIRRAALSDLNTLVAFNTAMADETEDKTLEQDTLRAGIRTLLQDEQKGRYWVAEQGGRVVGALMCTTEWSDWRNGAFWWIQSVYVRPEMRRQGVFTALYEHVHAKAQAKADVCGLRLYVERENAAAQSTYEARGMARTAYQMYETEV